MRRGFVMIVILLASAVNGESENASTREPPYEGVLYLTPDILTAADPTALHEIAYKGLGTREMFDRRVDDFRNTRAFLFEAIYLDGLTIEVQVNQEFGEADATVTARKYAREVGRLPTFLRDDVKTMWIHRGDFPAGGGNDNILIHVDYAEDDEESGFFEEMMIHEAIHASIDKHHERTRAWRNAQEADGVFISDYARDYPDTEDLAESFPLYVAMKYLPGRLPKHIENVVRTTIPNRLAYFESQNFGKACPIVPADCRPPESMASDESPETDGGVLRGDWVDLKQYGTSVLRHFTSAESENKTKIVFVNQTVAEIATCWVNHRGRRVDCEVIAAGESATRDTYQGHLWAVRDADGEMFAVFRAERETGQALVSHGD